MKYRLKDTLLAILFALIGIALVLLGLGIIKTSLFLQNQVPMVASGIMFFCAGTLVFFRATIGPVAENLPIYPWIQYLLILPILLGFGSILFWAGIVASNFFVIFLGVITTAAVIWFAISRWPGKEKTQ
jgi:hypothetical protein